MNTDPNWVTGFVDGEGHFRLGACWHKKRDRFNFVPLFSVSQRADDKQVLQRLADYFKVGIIRPRGASPTSGSPMLVYIVARIADFVRVASHFDQYPLQSKKQRDYLLWREGVAIALEAGKRPKFKSKTPHGLRRFTDHEIQTLLRLESEIKNGRAYRMTHAL